MEKVERVAPILGISLYSTCSFVEQTGSMFYPDKEFE